MQAIIMAAGKGNRLRPHTLSKPKPLLEVGERTILDRTLAALPSQVDEVIIVVGYLKQQIRKAVGEQAYGRPVRYVVHEVVDGTAMVVHACRDIVHGRFLVINGDDIYHAADLARLAERQLAVLMSNDATYAQRLGLCAVNQEGALTRIVEKSSPEHDRLLASGACWVNCGAYVLDERFFEVAPVKLQKSGEYGLPQTLVQLARQGVKIDVVPATMWHPIGTPEELDQARRLAAAGKLG